MELVRDFAAAQWIQAAGIAALIYWGWYCYKGPSLGKVLCKAAAIAPMLVAVWIFEGPLLLYVALGLCLLGDVMLVSKHDRHFLVGIAAFAAGHVAYILLFLSYDNVDTALILQMPYLMIVAVMIGCALVVTPMLFRGAGPLRWAVLAYVPMIVGLGIFGVGFAQSLPVVTLGALLFVASDLVLGLEMFVLREGSLARKIAPFWVWATYWMAQTLLVIGLA